MRRNLYGITRDLHLYAGLFISPFVLLFAVTVFFLVHGWGPAASAKNHAAARKVSGLRVPPNIELLPVRERVEAVRGVLDQAGVGGEVGFIRHVPKEHRLVVPVGVPGRATMVDIDVQRASATIEVRETGVIDGLITLHKLPGPHLAAIRMNWFPMYAWRWLADGTVILLLFVSVSGVYLWTALRSERWVGLILLAAGAFCFFGIVYAISG